ncbi:uncharacterized [Tachysurus ichikawai]
MRGKDEKTEEERLIKRRKMRRKKEMECTREQIVKSVKKSKEREREADKRRGAVLAFSCHVVGLLVCQDLDTLTALIKTRDRPAAEFPLPAYCLQAVR